MKRKLDCVEIGDSAEILALSCGKSLNGLQNFNRESLPVLDPFDVAVIRRLSCQNRLVSSNHLLTA